MGTERIKKTMTPYKVHLDNWTVALYATDDNRLTFTVNNKNEPDHYMTRLVGNVQLRRYHLGDMCAGNLKPSPFPTYREGKPMSKEAILAEQGAG
jgi:hypothetical protein